MKRVGMVLLFVFAVIVAGNVNAQIAFDEASQKQMVMTSMSATPMAFTENQGQWGDKTLFKAETNGATFYFCKGEVAYFFIRNTDELIEYASIEAKQYEGLPETSHGPRYKQEGLLIRARFEGANQDVEIIGEGMLGHKSNYFIGNDPSGWQTNVPSYSNIIYKNIYPGIDLKYYSNGGSLKYDFIVYPGADVNQIRIRYEGIDNLELASNGDMRINSDFGAIYDKAPKVYQEIDGRRQEIAAAYKLSGLGTMGFSIDESFDPVYPLIVDPQLFFSTYLGGIGYDYSSDIGVDSQGNIIVAGWTISSDFPVVAPYDGTYNGERDGFISKLSAAGDSLLFSTYIGGTERDNPYEIAIGNDDFIYVVGYTESSDYPMVNPFDDTYGGYHEAFVTKLSNTGDSLIYSTYLGGNFHDHCYDVFVDQFNQACVTGRTGSNDFPLVDPFDDSYGGGAAYGDIFISKFSVSGESLIFSTYLGGSSSEFGGAITLDEAGNYYITGVTFSADFPMVNSFDETFNVVHDAVVVKLSAAGDSILYSTFLGGAEFDYGRAIAVDDEGLIYIAGQSGSQPGISCDFPFVNAYSDSCYGRHDPFLAAINPFLEGENTLIYCTNLVGSGDLDYANSIALDSDGYVYISGAASDIPNIGPDIENFDPSGQGAFIAKFLPQIGGNGSLLFSKSFGGSMGAAAGGITIDSNDHLYIIGCTESEDFPVFNPYDDSINGDLDIFIMKVNLTDLNTKTYLPGDVNMFGGTWPPSATGPDVTYLVNFFRGTPTSPSCLLGGFWASADANGDCNVIGSDVTKLVNVFRGIGSIGYCPSYPPAWPTPTDLPAEAPSGWPNCE